MKMKVLYIALALLLMAALASCQSTAKQVDGAESFAADMEAAFQKPEMRHRPYARWWLAEGSHTDETLLESIHELYDAGFGGIEFVTLDESDYLNDSDYAWGSPEWLHDSRLIIEECKKLGMSVSMTSGTHWSTANLTTITPDDEAASQELGYTVTPFTGEGFHGVLTPCALPEGATQRRLVAAITVRVVDPAVVVDEVSGYTLPAKLDTSSMKNITASVVAADGAYSVDYVPDGEGDYLMFAFWQYGTAESYQPATSPAYTINYMSRVGADALIRYWDENVLTDDVQALIDGIDKVGVYMDSLELSCRGDNTTGLLWSMDMLRDFENRRGYAIDAALPYLILTSPGCAQTGVPVTYCYEPAEAENTQWAADLRYDFFQTMTELYRDNCLQVLADWLHARHMYLRAEPSYGKTFEISQPGAALDFIETESLEFSNEIESYRGLSGVAHLLNKRYSSETGALLGGNYMFSSDYLRQICYLQYAAGVQKTVVHGYSAAYGPEGRVAWPGYEGMWETFGERFSRRQPSYVDYPTINAHLSRIQKALESGVPQMDIAMLRTDYAFQNWRSMVYGPENYIENATHTQRGFYWDDMALQNAGYTYEYFSPYLLLDEHVTEKGGLLNPNGVAYQAIIVMEDELPYAAAEKLLAYARDGMPIVFVNHVVETVSFGAPKVNTEAGSITGSNDGHDEALKRVVAEIKTQPFVRTVESTADAKAALEELGVYPRAHFSEPNDAILTAMRKDKDVNFLYVYHYMYENATPWTGEIELDGAYSAYELDTWSGKVKAYGNCGADGDHTVLKLEMAPGDVRVFILKKGEVLERAAAEQSSPTEIKVLTGWTLSVDSFEPGERVSRTEKNAETGTTTTEITYDTKHVVIDAGELAELLPWKELEKVGPEVSGIGTYAVTFDMDKGWTRVCFHADSFQGGSAAVFINGESVPVNMETCRADLSDYIKTGTNTLEVRVTSSLRNRLLVDGYSGWVTSVEPDEYGMTGRGMLEITR